MRMRFYTCGNAEIFAASSESFDDFALRKVREEGGHPAAHAHGQLNQQIDANDRVKKRTNAATSALF